MKLKTILAAIAAATALNLQAQEWTDVTSTYITDPDFESCTPVNTGSLATGSNTRGASYPDQGWTCETTSHYAGTTWSNAAVMNNDNNATNKRLPNNANFPDLTRRYVNTDDNKNGLAIIIGRSTEIIYRTNEVTLPAGHYILTVMGRNVNISSSLTSFPSQLGFVGDAVSYKSTKTSFTAWTWVEDRVEFSLAVPTTGRIQLGGYATANSSADHAFMVFDHVKLQYMAATYSELLADLLTEASAITVPTENIGDGAFEFSEAPITAFTQAKETAQAKLDANAVTSEDVTALRAAIDAYNAVKDELNRPAAGANYKLQLAHTWESGQYQHLSLGFVTLANTLTNQGGYVLSIGTATEAFTDKAYLAQQFTLTPNEDVQNGYIFSMVDKEGNTRYVSSHSSVNGGSNLRIRTVTDPALALTIRIEYAGMQSGEPTFHLYSTEAPTGTCIGFVDRNAYCWTTTTANLGSIFWLHEKSAADLPAISLNMTAGRYATRIFPFVRTAEGELISDLLAGKANIYTCAALVEGTNTLDLTPLEGALQAHTPYILEATDNVDLTLTGYGTAYETTTEYTAGLLTGTYASTGYAPEGCYILQTQDGQQAFYRVDGSAPIPLAPWRVWLNGTASTGDVKALHLSDHNEQPTGIDVMLPEDAVIGHDAAVYDPAGRRLTHLQRGLNIIRTNDGRVRKIYR